MTCKKCEALIQACKFAISKLITRGEIRQAELEALQTLRKALATAEKMQTATPTMQPATPTPASANKDALDAGTEDAP